MPETTTASSASVSAAAHHGLVSVVVPARNEETTIGGCLDTVLAQDYSDLEVLVVDGGSTDATREVVTARAARDPRVRLLDNPEQVVPTALNHAVAAARGRWLVRVDAHATIPSGYVRRAVEHLASGRWGAVGGRKDGVGRTAAGRAIAAAMGSRFGVGNSTYHHGTRPRTVEHVPFGAYPMSLVRSLGGWDTDLAVNQDFEFDHRVLEAGHEILFDPELVIDWECRQSVRDLYRQYRRYGQGKTEVMRRHPGSVRPRHLAPPALVAGLAAATPLAAVVPWASAAFVGIYAVGLVAASGVTARRVPDWRARGHLPAAFAAMHVGWGIGWWQGAARLLRHRSGHRRASSSRAAATAAALRPAGRVASRRRSRPVASGNRRP